MGDLADMANQPGSTRPLRSRVVAWLKQPALYPGLYTWFVFASSLDLLFTWVILHHHGIEANAVADWVIQHYDLRGLIVFKFGMVALIVLICEIVGRRRYQTGLTLARWMVALAFFPVLIGAAQLVRLGLAESGRGPPLELLGGP